MTATGVRFAEKENAQDLSLEPNLEKFGNIYLCEGAGGSGNGIRYFAVNAASLLTNGPFTKQSNYADIAAFPALRRAGIAAVNNAAAQPTAKTLTVTNTDTEGLWREMDTITLTFPSEGISEQTATVLGYDFEENSPTVTVYLDQAPMGSMVSQLARLHTQVNDALAGGARAQMTSANGLSSIDLSGQQAIVIKDANGVVRFRAGLQTDGKYGVRAYDASGNLINTSTSTAFDYSA